LSGWRFSGAGRGIDGAAVHRPHSGLQYLMSVRPSARWVLTGNQLGLSTDLSRRCYRIMLDPKRSYPERRVFKCSDLDGWILKNRRDVVVALIGPCPQLFRAGAARTGDYGDVELRCLGGLDRRYPQRRRHRRLPCQPRPLARGRSGSRGVGRSFCWRSGK